MRRKYLIAVSLALIVLFSPTLLMIGWRPIYRAHVSYMGVTVNVPYGWLPVPQRWKNSPRPEFFKVAMTIFGRSQGFMSLELNRAPQRVNDESTFQSWRHAYESFYAPRGYAVQGPIRPGVDSYCLVARPPTKDADIFANCYLRRGEWYASFNGHSNDLDVFVDTVRRVQ
jgi:hypothetical protein